MPGAAIVATLLLIAADGRAPPVCDMASHDRLIVRAERDVCAPSLNRHGRPIAMGFLPTRCGDEARTYRIDAAGAADRCVVAPAAR